MDSAVIDKIISIAEQKCLSIGSRLTHKRQAVFLGLLNSQKALSAYELADYCGEVLNEPLPPMSVYRILGFLEKADLVHKLRLPNKYVVCSHIACEHRHQVPQFLICGQCDRVEEIYFPEEVIKSIMISVDRAGFNLIRSQLEMSCICHQCAI